MLKDQAEYHTQRQCDRRRGPGQSADGKYQAEKEDDPGERDQEGYPSPRVLTPKVFKAYGVIKSYPPSLSGQKSYTYP